MPDSLEPCKLDILVICQDVCVDWCTVDCIMELKNDSESNTIMKMTLLCRSQKGLIGYSLFNAQNDRRYVYQLLAASYFQAGQCCG
jgi:hypothetical protein